MTDTTYRDIIDSVSAKPSQPWTELHAAIERETPDPPPLVLQAYEVAHIVGLLRTAQEKTGYLNRTLRSQFDMFQEKDMTDLRDCLRYALETLDPE